MKRFLLLLCVLAFRMHAQPQPTKQRILILTDIENEPDDAQSMVRFLTYSNQWDVEGLIATTSVHQPKKTAGWKIREIVQAYGKVRSNLLLHEKGFPATDDLLRIIKEGFPAAGMEAVGAGKDSQGSDFLISVVDKADTRPVWIPIWGGANCLAQALWKVKMTRTAAQVDAFVAKLRVYTISDQDDSGPWIRKTFPNLFYIVSPGYHAKGGYRYSTWIGISSKLPGPDFTIVDNPWLDTHVRSHGPLGAQYPHTEYIMEGDTPTFLYLIPNGLGNPEHPEYGSWGGRYESYTPRTRKWFYEPETRPIWTDTEDGAVGTNGQTHTSNKATVWRWRQAYQHDFAARMDWTIKPYKEANHPPVARLGHAQELRARSGETIQLSAEGSTDPDGDALSYEWIYYGEAGSYASNTPPVIRDTQQKNASFTVPKVTQPETIHIILAVTDQGTPTLTRYQRVIISVFPQE